MNNRIFSLILTLGLICLPSLAAEKGTPRMPSGKPDLSGTYDVKTLTPYLRDPKYGNSLFMSAKEAGEVGEAAAATVARENSPLDPDRAAPPPGGTPDHQSNVGGHGRQFFDRGTMPFAVDGEYRTSILTDPPDGRLPPLSEAGKKYQAPFKFSDYQGPRDPEGAWWLEAEPVGNKGELLARSDGEHLIFDHPELQSLGTRCIYNSGRIAPVMPGGYNSVNTITQTETHVVILTEWFHWARIVRLAAEGHPLEHLPAEVRSFAGDSIGWWEGDTLVVETTNFIRSTGNYQREPGAPHEGLRLVERFRQLDSDTLFYEFTVEDPDRTAPYTGSFPWPRINEHLYEYACHAGNYTMGNVLRGARLLEQESFQETGR